MIFIKIRIVCAAFWEECPFYGHSALSRSALVAVVQPPPEFKWQEQILSEENEKNIKQSGGINDLKNVKDIQIENENKAFIQTLGCDTKIFWHHDILKIAIVLL